MLHTQKLTRKIAKSVARAQLPPSAERRHRRWVMGILMHEIIREVNMESAMAEASGMAEGDIIQFNPYSVDAGEGFNAQGLFRVKLIPDWKAVEAVS